MTDSAEAPVAGEIPKGAGDAGQPDDLSVVGFDNVLMAGLARINLTTVAQPQEELARLSVATLAARVEGELTGDPVTRTVKLDLVVRGSTAAPRLVQREAG